MADREKTIRVKIEIRSDVPETWVTKNPLLRKDEPGRELGTELIKYGDGVHRWNDLPYANQGSGGTPDEDLQEHIDSPEPHPIYDDGPSLLLLYENAKV